MPDNESAASSPSPLSGEEEAEISTVPGPSFTEGGTGEGLPPITPPANIVTDPKAPGATLALKEERIEVAGPPGVIRIAKKDLQDYLSRGYRVVRRG